MLRPTSRRLLAGLAALVAVSACTPTPTATTGAAGGTTAASTGVAPSPSPAGTAGSPTASAAAAACRTQAENLPLDRLSMQVMMVGVGPSMLELDGTTKRFLAAGVGSLIYVPGTDASVDQLAHLSALLHTGSRIKPIVAVDQEGGYVIRFWGEGFTRMPPAADQARLETGELRRQAAVWGADLARAGIDLNLAPVADVVPPKYQRDNGAISQNGRGYGSDPQIVAEKTGAVIDGFHDGGVAATLKHYPGLGRTTINTDAGAAHDPETVLGDSSLAAFAAQARHADALMVSNAIYDRIDPTQLAAYSRTILASARTDLGFEGPILSDDLGAAGAVMDVPAGERAVRFVAAGGDVVVTVDPATVDEMAEAMRSRAASDTAFRTRLVDAATRVLTLKQARGLIRCG